MESFKNEFLKIKEESRSKRGSSCEITSPLLSTEEVAKRFKMSLWWVRQQVKLGNIPVVVRKPFRFDGKAIDELIAAQAELKNVRCDNLKTKEGKSTYRKALKKEPLW